MLYRITNIFPTQPIVLQKLTKEEREFYKIKAKEQPSKEKDVPPERNCHGVLLTEVDRAAREAAEKQKYMEEKVNSIVEEGFLKNGKL